MFNLEKGRHDKRVMTMVFKCLKGCYMEEKIRLGSVWPSGTERRGRSVRGNFRLVVRFSC